MKKIGWMILLSTLVSGCAVGPDYQRPSLDIPAQFEQAPPPGWKFSQSTNSVSPDEWWTVFGDDSLNQWLPELNEQNLNIQIAWANYNQARASLGMSQSELLPNVNLSNSVTRSGGGSPSGVTAGANVSPISERKSVGVDASWELDLWGRIRRSVESAEAQSEASQADLQGVRLSMQAQFVQTYFMLRMTDELIKNNQSIIDAYAKSLDIAQRRYDAGMVTQSDVSAIKTQWYSAQANQINYQLSRTQYKNALAVLLGQAPSSFNVEPTEAWGSLPMIPPGLASDLLERRPDIISAERHLASSSAQIGVAQAAFYPSFSLSANLGSNASKIADLFTAPTEVWSLAASLGQYVFDGGKREAQKQSAEAAYEAALSQYRLTVLSALQETENALASVYSSSAEYEKRQQSLVSAQQALDQSTVGYEVGTTDLATLLQNQIAYKQAQLTLTQLHGQRYADTTNLIKALGGGWNPPLPILKTTPAGLKTVK